MPSLSDYLQFVSWQFDTERLKLWSRLPWIGWTCSYGSLPVLIGCAGRSGTRNAPETNVRYHVSDKNDKIIERWKDTTENLRRNPYIWGISWWAPTLRYPSWPLELNPTFPLGLAFSFLAKIARHHAKLQWFIPLGLQKKIAQTHSSVWVHLEFELICFELI
jgi:hypothetical protein